MNKHPGEPHPLWKKFSQPDLSGKARPLWVVSLSNPEVGTRDARALLDLKEFLARADILQVTYETVTVIKDPLWPQVPKEAGLVILGRPSPSLFGKGVTTLLEKVEPPLGYKFVSDDPSLVEPYRTIQCCWHETLIPCPLFAEQRRKERDTLQDNAIVYSGWQGGRPLMILAGTSSVGTWGAVKYVTEPPIGDIRSRGGDLQGVIAAKVRNTQLAFHEILESDPFPPHMLAPFEVAFSGSSLPWNIGWENLRLGRKRDSKDLVLEMHIDVNGRKLPAITHTHLPLLTLMAWLDPQKARACPSGYVCEDDRPDFVGRVFDFLMDRVGPGGKAALSNHGILSLKGFRSALKTAIYWDLDLLTREIQKAGGLAFERLAPTRHDKCPVGKRYSAFLQSLPVGIPPFPATGSRPPL